MLTGVYIVMGRLSMCRFLPTRVSAREPTSHVDDPIHANPTVVEPDAYISFRTERGVVGLGHRCDT